MHATLHASEEFCMRMHEASLKDSGEGVSNIIVAWSTSGRVKSEGGRGRRKGVSWRLETCSIGVKAN